METIRARHTRPHGAQEPKNERRVCQTDQHSYQRSTHHYGHCLSEEHALNAALLESQGLKQMEFALSLFVHLTERIHHQQYRRENDEKAQGKEQRREIDALACCCQPCLAWGKELDAKHTRLQHRQIGLFVEADGCGRAVCVFPSFRHQTVREQCLRHTAIHLPIAFIFVLNPTHIEWQITIPVTATLPPRHARELCTQGAICHPTRDGNNSCHTQFHRVCLQVLEVVRHVITHIQLVAHLHIQTTSSIV